MIITGTDSRLLFGVTIALGVVGAAMRGQEQRYREREVLNPETGEWVAREVAPEHVPEGALDQARAFLAAGEPKSARKVLQAWLEENADSDRYFEARWLLGEAYYELGDFWKAAESYDTVAENSSGELFEAANRRSVDVARAFLAGRKRIVWKIFRFPAYDEAVEILDKVWQRMPGSRLGELALKLTADFHFERGDMDLAQDEYAFLVQQYPAGRFVQIAMLRAAEAAYAAFPGVKFDARPLVEAQERYRQLEAAFPGYAGQENVEERLEGIRQQLAEKDLDIARWYERTKKVGAAEFYYRLVLKDWPGTLAADDARVRLRALGVDVDSEREELEQ